MRVHHEKERWGESSPYKKGMALEFTMTKTAMGMRVNHEKKSDGVSIHHKKERWGDFSIRKSDEMRVHHLKERWGESSS